VISGVAILAFGEMFASSADGDVRLLAWLPAFQWLVMEDASLSTE
jgi:hypothetical protein